MDGRGLESALVAFSIPFGGRHMSSLPEGNKNTYEIKLGGSNSPGTCITPGRTGISAKPAPGS